MCVVSDGAVGVTAWEMGRNILDGVAEVTRGRPGGGDLVYGRSVGLYMSPFGTLRPSSEAYKNEYKLSRPSS